MREKVSKIHTKAAAAVIMIIIVIIIDVKEM